MVMEDLKNNKVNNKKINLSSIKLNPWINILNKNTFSLLKYSS